MKRLLYLIFMMALCLTACRTAKQNVLATSPPVILTDSVIEKYQYIETLRLDTVFVEIEVPAQTASNTTYEGKSHLETDFAKSDAWINSDGSLGHSLENKEQTFKPPAVVASKDTESSTEKEKIKPVPVPYPEPYPVEKELTWWQSFQMESYWYLVSLCVIFGLSSFRKPLFSLVKKCFS